MADAATAAAAAAPEDAAAAVAAAEKTPEEIKAEQQKAAMLAMAAAAAAAAEAEARKKKKGGRGKKKKGSWDLLAPKDRHTRFWVEQFGRDSDAGNAEAAKLQLVVDKKAQENKKAKENWESEVKKMLKFLYQMDKKVEETSTNGSQAIIDYRQSVADKKAKYEDYWARALSLDPYEELVVDHSIGRTLSFVVLAQIAQPWGQLSEKLEIATAELDELTYFKDHGQYENEAEISTLEAFVLTMLIDLNAHHDFLEALMDKMKRRGLRRIARKADDAKHAAAQTLLTLLSPAEQEEIKNHAWFRSERRFYRKDEEITFKEVDKMETENLQLIKRVLEEEEERLREDVKMLEEEVSSLKASQKEDDDDDVGAGISTQHDVVKETQSNLRIACSVESKCVRFLGDEIEESDNKAENRGGGGGSGAEDDLKTSRRNTDDFVDSDPFRPPCALPYDVPERLARIALEMTQTCRANTTNINNPKYVVDGKSMTVGDAFGRIKSSQENKRKSSASTSSSTNEFGGKKKKWPVTAKMMNSILPVWDPRKRPPKDEAPRNFQLANGRKPWDPSLI